MVHIQDITVITLDILDVYRGTSGHILKSSIDD